MNLAAAIREAHRRAPAEVKGTVTFINPVTKAEASAVATANPARGTQADGFEAATAIRQTHLVLAVMPDTLAFVPAPGHQAWWNDALYVVKGAVPIRAGDVTLFYRVTVGQ